MLKKIEEFKDARWDMIIKKATEASKKAKSSANQGEHHEVEVNDDDPDDKELHDPMFDSDIEEGTRNGWQQNESMDDEQED